MSVSASIPDTSLGLTSSEIQILRQQQQLALQGGHTGGGVTRGRGTGRTSNASSRAASAASSHGRLLLDPMSLRALSHQLDNLQEQIRNRLDYVCSSFFFLSRFPSLLHIRSRSKACLRTWNKRDDGWAVLWSFSSFARLAHIHRTFAMTFVSLSSNMEIVGRTNATLLTE